MTHLVAWPNGRDLPRLDLSRLPAPRRRGDPHVRDGRRARYCCPVSVQEWLSASDIIARALRTQTRTRTKEIW